MHKTMRMMGLVFTLVMLCAAAPARAQNAKTAYPSMAPVEQYMMERDAEIALARTAAPPSISADADVVVLGKRGYETAVHGKNGFTCIVQRSWTAESDDPSFWNPKLRAPICFNAEGTRSYLPIVFRKTELVLAGRPKDEIFATVTAAIDKKELPSPEPGAMCYMMSKDGYLNDEVKNWHPHVMFFVPIKDADAWGAGLAGSPIIQDKVEEDRLVIFMIKVAKWSDGTADAAAGM